MLFEFIRNNPFKVAFGLIAGLSAGLFFPPLFAGSAVASVAIQATVGVVALIGSVGLLSLANKLKTSLLSGSNAPLTGLTETEVGDSLRKLTAEFGANNRALGALLDDFKAMNTKQEQEISVIQAEVKSAAAKVAAAAAESDASRAEDEAVFARSKEALARAQAILRRAKAETEDEDEAAKEEEARALILALTNIGRAQDDPNNDDPNNYDPNNFKL